MNSSTRMLAVMAIAVSMMPMLPIHAEWFVANPSGVAIDGPAAFSGSPALGLQSAPAAPSHMRHKRHTPKAELFLGYTHFGTGSTQTVTGNRMVGLNGGSTSLAFNFSRHLGLVADFGGYDDSQLQLTGTGANLPLTVNSSGTAYTYLFGPRLSFRGDRLTPFVQVLGGGVHASAVTVSACTGSACSPLPVQNAFAMTAGGGLDIRLFEHVSLRIVQAEYMMTRFGSLPSSTGTSQNDLRLSSGLVFGFGGRAPRLPLALTCSVQPESGFPGDSLTVTASATNLDPRKKVSYSWSANGGAVSGSDATATVTTAGIAPGTYIVSGHAVQGNHPTDQANCTASFTIQAFAPPTVACSANPSVVTSGDTVTVTAQGASPQNRTLSYSYSASAGTIAGNTATASLSTSGVAPGSITVTCSVVDDLGKTAAASTGVTVTAPALPVMAKTSELCGVSFDRDSKRPVRVDNEAKGCLDEVALEMQRESAGQIVIIGNYAGGEKPEAAAERALNVRQYLTDEKGIDPRRIDLRVGTAGSRTVTNIFVPAGATYSGTDTTPVDATIARPGEAYGKPHK